MPWSGNNGGGHSSWRDDPRSLDAKWEELQRKQRQQQQPGSGQRSGSQGSDSDTRWEALRPMREQMQRSQKRAQVRPDPSPFRPPARDTDSARC